MSIIEILESRTKRMLFKDVPFKTFKVSEDELSTFIESSASIDPTLPTKIASKKLGKADLISCTTYHEFLRTHCKEGEYVFQIRKCSDVLCCSGQGSSDPPNWLPSPIPSDADANHYKKLAEVLGNDPNDDWVPSIKYGPPKFDEVLQGCPSSVLSAQNLRRTVQCKACKRSRGVYCKRKLSNRGRVC